MSQHVAQTCPDGDGTWLPLTEYAVRSGISLSTIRRKIKTNSILYRLDKGRYLIFMEASHDTLPTRRPTDLTLDTSEEVSMFHTKTAAPKVDNQIDDYNFSVLDRTLRTVSHSFEQTLKEKDERIALLEKRSREQEDRICELKTLVRALEEKFKVRY
jgi:hypothetical protein